MYMRKIVTILLISLLATACSKKTTTITPINLTSSLSPHGMVYALPLTTYRIKVESVQIIEIPGPYAQFAERFMGISNVITKKNSEWEIQSVDATSDNEADISALFVIEPNETFQSDFLKLTSQGLIIPTSNIHFDGINKVGMQPAPEPATPIYTDLSTTPFIVAERTTHYSRVFQDSTFVRVPVHKTVTVEKSIEDKALEAAEFIFLLRKRRFELLNGDADFIAEGKAAEAVLKEISKLEQEYLSLFIGKSFEQKSTHWFDYTPKPNGNSATILFRFSPSKGVVSASDLSGSPVLISASPNGEWQGTELLKQLSTEKETPRTDAVYFRIPIPIDLKVTFENQDLFHIRTSVYQFGPLVRMPANFFMKEYGNIHFMKPEQ